MGEHCFISYSNADALDFATQLATQLEGGQPFIKVWFDKNEMSSSGPDWDEQIASAISTCKCLIFVMSVDSTARHSNCKTEWTWALKCKKPIICILLDTKAEEQFSLLNRQKIDFTSNFEAGIAKLRLAVGRLDSPEGLLDELNHRLAEANRDLHRAKAEDQPRIQSEIEILNEQIKRQAEIVADPKAAEKRTEANIQSGLERERQPEKLVTGKSSTKFINPPPGIAPSYFQDRQTETKEIVRFLHDDAQRLLTVVGRGGVGKTAMVCRLLKHIENGDLPDDLISIFGETKVDGIVYLSESGSHRVNFANLFAGLSKLLPPENAAALERLYKDPQVSSAAKMATLLDQFPSGRVILLLDNLETLINVETFGIGDSELDESLRAFLSGAHSGVKMILTTRIAPRPLNLYEPGRQRILYLDEGLESPYAENILREMDADGKLGLKNAPDALLAQAREYTRGFPRALEALFAILAADRYTSLGEILARGKTSMPVNVIQALVGEAFHRLDGDAQKVMQALAVYNRPVSTAAIDYLLQPHLPGIDSAPMLNRLVTMQFVRRESGRYYLHPVDREFALSQIPTTETISGWAKRTLTLQAADYFAQARKPRTEWKKLDDLAAQLAEFALRCEAGDYNTAADVLVNIDYDFLMLWGNYHLLIEMHEKLQGKIDDTTLARKSIGSLGQALERIGKVKEAITNYERALTMARNAENRQAEGAWLGNLGDAYAFLDDAYKAIEFHHQALMIAREIADRYNEGLNLNSLGNAYISLGEIRKAIEFFEQCLMIAREIGKRRIEQSALSSLGNAYNRLGEVHKAIEFFEQQLMIAREIGDRSGEGGAIGNLGNAYAGLGEVHKAIEFYEQQLIIAYETGDRGTEGMAISNIACQYLNLGEYEKSITHYQKALQNAREIENRYGESKRLNGLAGAFIGKGNLRNAIQHAQAAIQIGQEISSPEVCIESGWKLALALLLSENFKDALQVTQDTGQYDQPHYNFNISALHGIITLRQGEITVAQVAFRLAVVQADEILAKTPDFYQALDTKGLALCGLALCNRGAITDEDKENLQQAVYAFTTTRKIAPHIGVVKEVLQLFDELAKCDPEGVLIDVRKTVAGLES